jgi:hypothetical protein
LTQVLENTNQSIFSKLQLRITERDIILLVLVAITYISVYYVPPAIGLLMDLGITYYCFRSKHPLILLLLFVIVNSKMNGMLDINKLPRISLAGSSVSLLDFLTLSMWLKVLVNFKIIVKSTFGRTIFLVYLVLLSTALINALITNIDLKLAIRLIRFFSYYVCYFYVLLAFKDFKDFNFIIKVLFFISLVVIANQITLVLMDKGLDTILFGQRTDYSARSLAFTGYAGDYMSDKSRGDVGDATDPLLLFITCLALFGICKDKRMHTFMQFSIMMIIMIELILAARAYFIFILFPLLAYAKNVKNILHLSKTLVLLIILMLIIFIVIGGFGFTYFHDIFLRISGVYKFLNPTTRSQVETGVSRIEEAQGMITVILKSPIFGVGFSSDARELNSDLGFLNTMILMGFIGLFIYLMLFMRFISMCLNVLRRISNNNPLKTAVQVLLYSMISLLIGYATTQDFFISVPANIAFICIFLGLSEIIFSEALQYEHTQNLKIMQSN